MNGNRRLVTHYIALSLTTLMDPTFGQVSARTASMGVGLALDRPALQTPKALKAVMQAGSKVGSRLVAVGERGVILVSDDRGRQWRQVPSPTSVGLTGVRFLDARRGWAIGHGGVVLATVDAGETWQRRFDGRQAAQLRLDGAKSSGDEKAIAEAQRIVDEGADKPLLDLHFFDSQRGWVVGAYNFAFATDDGGATWRPLVGRWDNPKSLHLYALRARNDAILIAGEQGLVLLSQDAGRSFRRLNVPYRGSFFTAEILGDQEFLVAGLRGNVWRSQDAGATWQQLVGGLPVNVTASGVDEAGSIVLATQAGTLVAVEGDQMMAVASGLKLPNGVLSVGKNQWLVLTFEGPLILKAGSPGAVK